MIPESGGISTFNNSERASSAEQLSAARQTEETAGDDSTPGRIIEGLFGDEENGAARSPEETAREQLANGQRLDVRV